MTFVAGRPVTTTTPTVDVRNDLAPGTHQFTLMVVDSEGTKSDVARASVIVGPLLRSRRRREKGRPR